MTYFITLSPKIPFAKFQERIFKAKRLDYFRTVVIIITFVICTMQKKLLLNYLTEWCLKDD